MALLKPMPRRASRKELTDALSAHYGSPGRLANYRREFDKTVRKSGEDPSNFAIALETLAVKAFGDMGQAARLRLIRDRFIAGHGSCELSRYLDCVPSDTPLRDIVDRCRVWESHADTEVRRVSKPMPESAYLAYVVNESEYETEPVRVVTVNKPNSSVDQMEELLKRLLAVLTPAVPTPAKVPETSLMDKLVQLLLSETGKRKPARYRPNQQDWKRCFERISRNSSRHDNSPNFDRHDEARRTRISHLARRARMGCIPHVIPISQWLMAQWARRLHSAQWAQVGHYPSVTLISRWLMARWARLMNLA